MNRDCAHSSGEAASAAADAGGGHGVRLTAVGALLMLIVVLMSWASTDTKAGAATALPAHGVTGMDYCFFVSGIQLSTAYAFRSDNAKPETVYWKGALQKWNGTGWSTVAGSTVPWQGFGAAWYSYDRTVKWGALIGSALPTWPISVSGHYRVINRFYWSRTGRYSNWEPTRSCYVMGFS